jgi:hypothetical protein
MTVVGGLELGRELAKTHVQIVIQMEEIRQEAERTKIEPVKMRDSHGNYIWAPLLAAKAQTLHALVLINQRG